MARTLADLIRTVSENVGDLYEGTLTSGTNATTCADSGRTEGDGWWTGGNLSLVSPASPLNAFQDRPITNWVQVGGVFTTNAFPATPSANDGYQIRKYPKHTRTVVKDFINQAVRDLDRQAWIPIDSVADLGSTQTYTIGRPWYPVPAAIEMVHRVLYQDIHDVSGSNPWYELDQATWTTNTDGGVLIQPIDNYVDWDRSTTLIPDGAPLRFQGSKRPTEMTLDTDVAPIDGNYLETYATARLCLRLAGGATDSTDFNAKFQMYYKLQTDAFRSTHRALPGGSRKVQP